MLATQPPGARAAAGKHKKEKTVTLKNKAISKEESVKPYVQDCLYHVTRIAIKRWKHITACLDHVTRIAIERWKDITYVRWSDSAARMMRRGAKKAGQNLNGTSVSFSSLAVEKFRPR